MRLFVAMRLIASQLLKNKSQLLKNKTEIIKIQIATILIDLSHRNK